MTRNTQLYKSVVDISGSPVEIVFRDLTLLEISFIRNIKNPAFAAETAGRISIINKNPSDLHWAIVTQIGQIILSKAYDTISSEVINKGMIEEFKEKVDNDGILYLVVQIKRVFPSESILSLLNLTYKDLVELAVLGELITGETILSPDEDKKSGKRRLVNPKDLPDGGKALLDNISKLNQQMGY